MPPILVPERHEYLPGGFLHVSRLFGRAREHDHFGRAVPNRPRLPEGFEFADQDCGVHQRHEMRARAAGEVYRLRERKGQGRGWFVSALLKLR